MSMERKINFFFCEWFFMFLCMYCFVGGNGESKEPSRGANGDGEVTDSDGDLSSTGKLLLYAAALATFLLLGGWLLNCNLLRSKRPANVAQSCHPLIFEAQDLWVATRGYHADNLMGATPWGSLFKAVLRDGLVVAIKRLNLNNSDEANRRFSEILDALTRLRHRNLVRILGFSVVSDYKEIVTEYADYNTLDHYLQRNGSDLNWETRLKIAHGTASALVYLHQECGVNNKCPVVHGNIKPCNIFVKQDDQEPLLSDYGIASLIENFSDSSSAFRGLCGYTAPECKKRSEAATATATAKSDVYSFGMVLLELLTLKRPSSDPVLGDLPGWVRYQLCHKYAQILDPSIFTTASTSTQKEMVRVLGLALMCTRHDPHGRPSMKCVLDILIEIIKPSSDASKNKLAPLFSEIEEVV